MSASAIAPSKSETPLNSGPAHPDRHSAARSSRQPSARVAKAAAEIKGLFHLTGARPDLSLPPMAPFRAWTLLLSGASLPLLGLVAIVVGLLAATAVLSSAYALVEGLSALLAILLFPPLGLLLSMVAVLLIRPFLPAPPRAEAEERIGKADDPRLTLMVTAVCKLIGFAKPSAIFLCGESRLTVRGPDGMPASAENYELVIGTPLLACLSISDFTALLARSLGRLAQPETLRPFRLMLRIENYLDNSSQRQTLTGAALQGLRESDLAEAAKKGLGNWLQRLARIEDLSLRLLSRSAQRCARLRTRRDALADSYQRALTGTASAELADRISAVETACELAREDAELRHHLVDSLAALSARHYRELLGSDGCSTAASPQGIVRSQAPAASLLSTLNARDRDLSCAFYQARGLKFRPEQLLSISELERREANRRQLETIAQSYYGKWLQARHHWQMPAERFAEGADRKILISRLNNCIQRIRYLSPDRPRAMNEHQRLRDQLSELRAAKKVLSAGGRFRFRHCLDHPEDIDKAISTRRQKLREYTDELAQQNTLMGERLALAFAVDQKNRRILSRLQQSLQTFGQCSNKIRGIAADLEELTALESCSQQKLPPHFSLHLKEINERMVGHCRYVRRKLQNCPYGFFDRRFDTVDKLLDARLRQAGQPGSRLTPRQAASILLEVCDESYSDISQFAASFGMRVEKAYGVDRVKRVESVPARSAG